MANISKITLPSGDTYDIKDSRVPGIDNKPTSGSENLVKSGGVYSAMISPSLAHSSYEGFASSSSYSVHCGLYFRPSDWNKMYTFRFRVHAYVTSQANVESMSDIIFQCYQGVVKSYYISNGIADTDNKAYYQLYFYGVTAAGHTAGAQGYVGIYINSANCWSYTTKRQIEYDVIHAEGCTVGLFSSDLNTVDARQGFATSYFLSSVKYNTYSAGLQETGDNNTTYSIISDTELRTGTATSSRTVSAARLAANYSIATDSNTGVATVNIAGNTATVPPASSSTPVMDGTAAVGTSSAYAKADHVHPKDTSKQDTLVSGTNIKTINSTSLLGSGDISVGTYSKPSGGIPKTDLASAVQTSLGKADTALQSYTETDPTVPSWAKASSKPSYTLDEVPDGSTRKLSNYQPIDADLTAISGLSGTSGLLRKTAADTWSLDTNTYYYSGNSNKSDVNWTCANLTAATRVSIGSSIDNNYRLLIASGNFGIKSAGSEILGMDIINTNNNIDSGYIFFQSGGINGFKIASKYANWASRQSLVFYRSNNQTDPYTFQEVELMRLGYDANVTVTGNITATGTITPGSDSRIKNNQKEISQEDAFSVIENLKPKTWTWNGKSNENLNGKTAAGLVAQEVKEILPEAVTTTKTENFEDFHSLNYNTIQGYEIAAIKGLLKEVKSLKAEIVELKEQIK